LAAIAHGCIQEEYTAVVPLFHLLAVTERSLKAIGQDSAFQIEAQLPLTVANLLGTAASKADNYLIFSF
jgi:hypothetical protein